jgi:hypothetical protein
MTKEVWSGNLKQRDRLGDLGMNMYVGRIYLKGA